MMQQKYVFAGIIALVLIGAGSFVLFSSKGNTPSDKGEVAEVTGEPAVTITRTAQGYEPNEVTIKKGDIILWANESNEYHWPASDLHPTHGIYPEFDPLRPLAVGEDWKFQFNEVGEWKFHDHIRANLVGTITVTP